MTASLEQQESALRHAISMLSRPGQDGLPALGEPAMTWLRGALLTIEWLRTNETFAKALFKVIGVVESLGPIEMIINNNTSKREARE